MNPERPKWNLEMAKELAVKLAQIVSGHTNEDESENAEYFAKILLWHSDDDGWELAKQLEDMGYSMNLDFANDLDEIQFERRQIVESHIKRWVIHNSLKPILSIGDDVEYNELRKSKQGKIVCIYQETLQYGVRTPEQPMTSHYLINEENLQKK